MRKITVLCLGLLLLFMLAACGEEKPSPYTAVNTYKDIEMRVKEGSAGPTGVTLLYENKTAREQTYGAFYAVERLRDGAWVMLPTVTKEEVTWIALAYILTPGQTREDTLDWSDIYGSLPSGQYRVIKEFAGKQALAAEFILP